MLPKYLKGVTINTIQKEMKFSENLTSLSPYQSTGYISEVKFPNTLTPILPLTVFNNRATIYAEVDTTFDLMPIYGNLSIIKLNNDTPPTTGSPISRTMVIVPTDSYPNYAQNETWSKYTVHRGITYKVADETKKTAVATWYDADETSDTIDISSSVVIGDNTYTVGYVTLGVVNVVDDDEDEVLADIYPHWKYADNIKKICIDSSVNLGYYVWDAIASLKNLEEIRIRGTTFPANFRLRFHKDSDVKVYVNDVLLTSLTYSEYLDNHTLGYDLSVKNYKYLTNINFDFFDGELDEGIMEFSNLQGLTTLTINNNCNLWKVYGEFHKINASNVTIINENEENPPYEIINNCLCSRVDDDYGCLYMGFQNCSIPTDNYVTIICPRAFQNNTDLTSVVIPDNISDIKDYAFANCTSLTSVDFTNSENESTYGQGIFDGCTNLSTIIWGSYVYPPWLGFANCNLTELNFPAYMDFSVDMVGGDCFGNNNVSTITVDTENEYMQSISNCVISKGADPILFMGCKNSDLSKINGLKYILGSAFAIGCPKVLTIPDGATWKSSRVALMDDNLETINLPDSIIQQDDITYFLNSNIKYINCYGYSDDFIYNLFCSRVFENAEQFFSDYYDNLADTSSYPPKVTKHNIIVTIPKGTYKKALKVFYNMSGTSNEGQVNCLNQWMFNIRERDTED